MYVGSTHLGLVYMIIGPLIGSTNDHNHVVLAFVHTEIVDGRFESVRIF